MSGEEKTTEPCHKHRPDPQRISTSATLRSQNQCVCSHRGRNGFLYTSQKGFLFNHMHNSKSHCVISQEPFWCSVRTLSLLFTAWVVTGPDLLVSCRFLVEPHSVISDGAVSSCPGDEPSLRVSDTRPSWLFSLDNQSLPSVVCRDQRPEQGQIQK